MEMDSSKLIERYLKKMRKIQNILLEAINGDKEKKIQDIIIFLDGLKICDNHDEFKSILHLLSILYETHHQNPENMIFIEKLIIHYKDYIQKNFQNCEIFTIFKKDKKLLLFLIQSGIIKIDKSIKKFLEEDEYKYFFYQEIKDTLKHDTKNSILNKIPDDYIFKREKGENDSYLSEIIRKDSIDDFISYVSKTNISLNNEIKESIFETNSFLIGKNPTLIEYSAFYGSIQIFKYLQLNLVELTESIWPFAIQSQNTEIISILEDKNIKPDKEKIKKYYKKAIKCHHNDIANYIQENYIEEENKNEEENYIEEEEEEIKKNDSLIYFKYYNFEFIKPELIDKSIFIDLCNYDYPIIVDVLMKTEEIDINSIKIKEKANKYDENSFYLNEKSALSVAISNNNTEIAKLLLTKDDINVNYKYKNSMLILTSDLKSIIPFSLIVAIIYLIFEKSFNMVSITPIVFGIIMLISCYLLGCKNALNTPLSMRMFLKIRPISLNSFKLICDEVTVLHLACYNNNTEIVKVLMTKQNIDVNVEYEYMLVEESNALNIAVGNEEIVKCLLSNPNIDVNFKYKKKYLRQMNYAILISAVILPLCNSLIISILLLALIYFLWQKFKNLSFINKIFVIVLIIFIIYVPFPKFIVTFLITIDNIFDLIIENLHIIRGILLLHIIIELIYSSFYTVIYEVSPLIQAIKYNYTESAKLLLSNDKIDVNSLYIFRNYDQFGDDDDDDNYDSENSMHFMKLNKDKYVTKTALNIAAKKGNNEIVKLLLLNKNIDVGAKYKSTTCFRIILLNNKSIKFYIIESIITSLFSSSTEKSSLIIAAENYNVNCVKQLLEKSSIKSVKYDYEKLKQDKIKKSTEQKGKDDKSKDDKKYNPEKFDEILELMHDYINGR